MGNTLHELYPELEQYEDHPVFDLPKLMKKIRAQRRAKEYEAQKNEFLEKQRARRSAGRRRSRREE